MTITRPLDPYQISWTPAAIVEREAKARGYTGAKGESFWDFVNEDDYTFAKPHSTFADALKDAFEKLPIDYAQEVRITRLVWLDEKNNQFAEDAVWYVRERGQKVDEDEPDYRPEIAE